MGLEKAEDQQHAIDPHGSWAQVGVAQRQGPLGLSRPYP